jgi:uncharacterized membrane protein (DUF485 family)
MSNQTDFKELAAQHGPMVMLIIMAIFFVASFVTFFGIDANASAWLKTLKIVQANGFFMSGLLVAILHRMMYGK